MIDPSGLPLLPLQMESLFSLPGILTTLLIVAVVILVARIVLRIAWKIVVVAAVVAAILWILGLLGPVGGLLGV